MAACGADPGGSAEASEVATLRAEVDALEARVEALEAALAERPAGGAAGLATPDGATAPGRPAFITWTFDVTPGGAEITLDGDLVEDQRWRGPGDGELRRLRIRRAGFRVVEQVLRADRDRVLRYALSPGRGVQHLPSPD